jgi:hypothetical protein
MQATHLLAMNSGMSGATDQTYNLGSTDHRWRAGYFQGVSLSISIGASHILYGTTAGGFKFVKDETTTFQFLSTYYKGHNATPVGPTTTAGLGQWAHSSPINMTLSNGNISGSTCTLNYSGNRPVMVGFKSSGDTNGASGFFQYSPFTTTVQLPNYCNVNILEDGAVVAVFRLEVYVDNTVGFTSTSTPTAAWPAGSLSRWFYPGAGAGNRAYSASVDITSTAGVSCAWVAENMRLFACELQ